MGCFNPILGQIWTNPAIGLHFLITFLIQCLTQNWVKTTQHFLEWSFLTNLISRPNSKKCVFNLCMVQMDKPSHWLVFFFFNTFFNPMIRFVHI